MGHGTSAVIQGIARPDAAIGIVEVVAIRVVVTLLPRQVALQQGPHLAHIVLVGIILEVPQQLIDIVQVHVVVVHLVVAIGITTDVAIGIHLRVPFLLSARHLLGSILRGMWDIGLDVRHLTIGIGIEVTDGSVLPSQHVAQITCAPTRQGHAPSDTAMQPGQSVPVAISSQHEGTTQRVDIRIGGIELDATAQLRKVVLRLDEQLRSLLGTYLRHFVQLNDHITLRLLVVRIGGRRNLQSFLLSIRFKHTRLVRSDVAITLQLRLRYLAHLHLSIQCVWEALATKMPHSTLLIRQRHHLYI